MFGIFGHVTYFGVFDCALKYESYVSLHGLIDFLYIILFLVYHSSRHILAVFGEPFYYYHFENHPEIFLWGSLRSPVGYIVLDYFWEPFIFIFIFYVDDIVIIIIGLLEWS